MSNRRKKAVRKNPKNRKAIRELDVLAVLVIALLVGTIFVVIDQPVVPGAAFEALADKTILRGQAQQDIITQETKDSVEQVADTGQTVKGDEETKERVTVSCNEDISGIVLMENDLIDCPGNGLNIVADGTVLDCDGHFIDGDNTGSDYGVNISGFNDVTVKNCNIESFYLGIYVGSSDGSIILNNNLSKNQYGMYLGFSSYITVSDNNISTNDDFGLYNRNVDHTTISYNLIKENGIGTGHAALVLFGSAYNNITGNNVTDNEYGIGLESVSEFNTLWGNRFSGNTENAYEFMDCLNNDWDFESVGNYWDDFASNPGYSLNEYWIPGDGNGIDHFPTGPPICVDEDGDGYGVCPDCDIINGCTYDGDDCNDLTVNDGPICQMLHIYYPSNCTGPTVAGCAVCVNPGAIEYCDSELDGDCDGETCIACVDGETSPAIGCDCNGMNCVEGEYCCEDYWGTGFHGLIFDSFNDWIEIPHSDSYKPTDAITLEATIYIEAFNGAHFEMMNQHDWNHYRLLVYDEDDAPGVASKFAWVQEFSTGYPGEFVGDQLLEKDRWYHVAATYDGADAKLYVNGTLVASRPQTGTIDHNSNSLDIGWFWDSADYVEGMMKDIRIYDRALSDLEVIANRDGTVAISGLLAWWKLDDGGTVAASTPSGNDGTVYGNADWLNGFCQATPCGGPEPDTTPPTIEWLEPPTPPDGSTVSVDYVYLDTIITDANRTAAFFDWNHDLVGYWSMDDYGAGGIYDGSSYGNDAGFAGGLSTANITEGMYGDALEFDGIYNAVLGDYLLVPDDDSLDMGTSDMTFSVWMKLEGSSEDYAVVFGKGADSNYPGYVFLYKPLAGSIAVLTDIGDHHRNSSSSNTNLDLDDDTWHHIVAVVDRDTQVAFYVDGQPEGTSTGLLPHAGIDILGDLDLTVGKWGEHINDHYLNGSLDEAMIFKRALSTEEVLALYDNQVNELEHNFTSLPDDLYTYSAFTIDEPGNINISPERNVIVGEYTPPECTDDDDCSDLTGYFCDGTISTHEEGICNDSGECESNITFVYDCSSMDGYYSNGPPEWRNDTECTLRLYINMEYRQHYCVASFGSCAYDVLDSFWNATEVVMNKDNGTLCNDSDLCTDTDQCESGVCVGTPVDCTANDILPAIATCDNDPDNNPFTYDFREAFISQCIPATGDCTNGSWIIDHTCNKSECGAECDAANPCSEDYFCNATCECELSSIECGVVITESINLTEDLLDCPEFGIMIAGDSITLDCKDHRITGIFNDSTHGVFINNSDNVIVKNCNISIFRIGLTITNSSYSTASNNILFNNSITGTSIQYTDNCLFTGNIFHDNLYGISEVLSSMNTFSDNYVSNNKFGIATAANTSNIVNNTIINNEDVGILLISTFNNIVSGNYISGTLGNGLEVYFAFNNTIFDNIITNNLEGIKFEGGSTNNTVYNNTVCNNMGYDFTCNGLDNYFDNNNCTWQFNCTGLNCTACSGVVPECLVDSHCDPDTATCEGFTLEENDSYCSERLCLVNSTTEQCSLDCGAECNLTSDDHETDHYYCSGQIIMQTIEGCDSDGCVWNDSWASDRIIDTCGGTGENDICWNGSDTCNHCDDGVDNDNDTCIDTDWECGDSYDPPNGYDDDCDGMIDEGYSNNLSCTFVSGEYLCTATPDGSHIQNSVAFVDGPDIQIELPLLLSGANGTHDITIENFYWQNISSGIKAKQGSNMTNVTVSGDDLSFTANFSRDLSLFFNVTPPTLVVHDTYTDENHSFTNFTVSSLNHLYDVKLNMSVNGSFPEYSVFWLSEDGWLYANALFDVSLVGDVLWIEDFDTSDQHFYANGTDTCTQSWICTPWSEGDCGTRICTCDCTSNACLGDHDQTKDCGGDGDSDGDSDSQSRWFPSSSSCEEDWICGSWGSCWMGRQTRTCTDLNNCGAIDFKPDILRDCETDSGDENESTYSQYDDDDTDTNASYNASSEQDDEGLPWDWFWLGLTLMIVIGAIVVFMYAGKKKKKKPTKSQEPVIQQRTVPNQRTPQEDDYLEKSLMKNIPAKKMVDALVAKGWSRKQAERELKRVESNPKMLSRPYIKKLDNYIKHSLLRGIPESKIVHDLLKVGWTQKLVDERLKRLK